MEGIIKKEEPKPTNRPTNGSSTVSAGDWVFRVSTTSRPRFRNRRTSLTTQERSLLQSLSSGGTVTSELGTDDIVASNGSFFEDKKDNVKDDNNLGIAKQGLAKSIKTRRRTLNSLERSFLEELVTCESSIETVIRAKNVLENDPLYNKNDKKVPVIAGKESKAHEDTCRRLSVVSTQEKPPIITQDGPSFRREMWTQYSSHWLLDKEAPKHALEEDEGSGTVTPENPLEKRVANIKPFASFWETVFGGSKESEKVQKPEATSLPDFQSFCVVGTSVDDSETSPHVLSPPIMDALRHGLPFAIQEDNYWLKYSMLRDGASIFNLLRCVRSSCRTVLAIETMDGHVFGSFTSSPWRARGSNHYGSAEAFVWRLKQSRFTPCATVEEQIALESDVEIFPWSGKNRNIQYLRNEESELVVGGGPPDDEDEKAGSDWGFALALTNDLSRGTSGYSATFDNPPLLTNGEDVFDISNIEVWTLSPVNSVALAEKLELGRQFVFDQGNFVEQ